MYNVKISRQYRLIIMRVMIYYHVMRIMI